MRSVVLFSQLLEHKYAACLGGEATKFLDYIVDNAKRMVDLVQGLLEFSRVEAQGQRFAATDISRTVAIARESLCQALSESGASVTCGTLPQVLADEVQIIHLFQNLISNAIKFRAAERPLCITIDCRRLDDDWEFSVGDNGIGIDPAYADQLFVIFKCLHTQDAYPGNGIGLALCKRIVERHGGRIWFESQPGEGATFRFTLPGAERGGH